MSDKDSFTSRSSLPLLLRDEDDDNDDEIVFFDDSHTGDALEDLDYDEYDYDLDADDLPPGYTRSELEQNVVFVRSSKDPTTGDFYRERKSLLWCVENDCEEATSGVWSGAWYFTYLFGEVEGKRTWVEAMNKRLVKECGGKAMKVDHQEFCAMLKEKDRGNRAFARGQHKKALDSYLKAEKLMGGAVSGMYLVPHQRAELVKVLSNQAECYLRMKKYEEAIVQSTAALQLDKRHQKSMLRRAKAVYYCSDRLQSLNKMVAARITEDLQVIIEMKTEGSVEAKELMAEIELKVNASGRTQQ
jgi:tetratricopeptide (TPR) repeat protein